MEAKIDQAIIDLLDVLARETFLRGGKVHVLPPKQMPDPNRAVNAIYRY